MLEQDRGFLHDLSVGVGLLLALILFAPAYLILAGARRVASLGSPQKLRAPTYALRARGGRAHQALG